MIRPDLARRRFIACSVAATPLAAALAARRSFASARAGASLRMRSGEPSATALGAAVQRALHQVIESPVVFDDPLAVPMLGPQAASALQAAADVRSQSRGLRAGIVLRSRYAEDRLAAAVARGVRQYVVLGAGLDTFAYRNPHATLGLEVFEVDHPATQAWKRERLQRAGIALSPRLHFVAVDFETDRLPQRLAESGFRFDRPAVFSMLGVVIYLTETAVFDTLRVVASAAAGSEIVFSFSLPERLLTEAQRQSRARSMARMAALGEPWVSFFDPERLAADLRATGFGTVELLGPEEANRTYFAGRSDGLRLSGGGHMAAALI